MAKNPMQKKVTNAFLLGMTLTLIIAAAIGAAVFMLVILPNQNVATDDGQILQTVYVVTRPIRYGEEVALGLNVERQQKLTTFDRIQSKYYE